MNKEGEIMARVINRINNVNVPGYVIREVGLSENWQEKISPREKKMVVKTALRFKEALRKLSKN